MSVIKELERPETQCRTGPARVRSWWMDDVADIVVGLPRVLGAAPHGRGRSSSHPSSVVNEAARQQTFRPPLAATWVQPLLFTRADVDDGSPTTSAARLGLVCPDWMTPWRRAVNRRRGVRSGGNEVRIVCG
jgi:hypothetical protein